MAETVQVRTINGCPDYHVGEDGSVWCSRRRGGHGGTDESARILKQKIGRHGYAEVTIYPTPRKPQYRLVHRLVLEEFIGPCPEGMECCHKNGNRLDNRAENLEWGSRQKNITDKESHGTTAKGSRIGTSKLTEDRIVEIRVRYASGRVTQVQLSKEFGVAQQVISGVVNRKTWKHVPEVRDDA